MLAKFKSLPKVVYVILALSFLLHVFCLVKQPGLDGELVKTTYGANDAFNYSLTAEQLLKHGVFGYVYLEPSEVPGKNAYITPGQPLLLAGAMIISDVTTLPYYYVATVINMLLNIGTLLLVFLIGRELFNKDIYGIVASILYAVYPSNYTYFRTLLTEVPSIFLLSLSVYVFVLAWKYNKVKFHIWFGIVVSILLMFRPNPAPMLLIPVLVVLFTYGFKESIKIGLLWFIGPFFIIGAWVVRNYLAFHQFILFSTQSADPLIAGADPFNKIGYENVVNQMKATGQTDKSEYAKQLIKNGFKSDFTYWFSWFTVGKTIELFKTAPAVDQYRIHNFMQLCHRVFIFSTFLSAFCFMLNSFKHKRVMMLVASSVIYIAFSNLFLAINRYGFFINPLMCLILAYGLIYVGSKLPFFNAKRV
ncbi:ArnT family glycosyltransferase [Bacillus gaemokensis]|uniref:4-amino-4-deoxy-L-arabinose transferase n=1 Tax=Bacillus gaemokensis TaxID=574375 RepID=A0A073KDD0_9BACI|nr:glycosyltransferase family 39 protein [Bacillus gaemokensis]KEK24595.1 4-amino-4-deoxy-L-arabinose transferase [Bacillus gaemokensis]KYG39481.1 4-amino-4-deoxy-L-arabinose transferase [Bacillus gaemokensis]